MKLSKLTLAATFLSVAASAWVEHDPVPPGQPTPAPAPTPDEPQLPPPVQEPGQQTPPDQAQQPDANHKPMPVTAVTFMNDCNDEPINLVPPDSLFNGEGPVELGDISVLVQIYGATPGARVWMKSEVGPIGYAVEPNGAEVKESEHHIADDGTLKVRFKVKARKWRKARDPSMIVAKVLWAEKDVAVPRGGGSSASIADPNDDTAYRIKRPVQCYWQSNTEVVSEYYFNPSYNQELRINREEELSSYVGRRFGIGIGVGNFFEINHRGAMPYPFLVGNTMVGSKQPILPATLPFEIWVFTNWTTTYATRTSTSLSQHWNLHAQDGGFIGRRYSFQRYNAIEFVKDKKKGCPVWKQAREGVLDVGVPSETLYSVPAHLQGDPIAAGKFMDTIMPPLNTCSDEHPVNRKFEVKAPNGDFVIFYPK